MLCDAPARKLRTHASHTAPPLPGRDHSRSPSTRVHMSGPATHGVVRDDVWLDQYVLIENASTVPSSSLPAADLASEFRVARSEPRGPAPSHRHPLP
eukprot:scaffold92985_cov94-Phaeocystis_antarctica.AAC.1